MNRRIAMVVVMVLVLAAATFTLNGCGGGGGGGGSTPTPAPPAVIGSLDLTGKTASLGDGSYGGNTITKSPESSIAVSLGMLNSSGADVSPTVSIVSSSSDITFASGSASVDYPGSPAKVAGKSAAKPVAVSDSIASAAGVNLGFTLAPGGQAYLYYNLNVSANATSGAKTVTMTVNGKTTTITITVSGGSSACQSVTNPTCESSQHLVAGTNDANGCPTAGTCVANTCSAIKNPVCNSGYNLVPGANDSAGCATVGSCVADVVQTGVVRVTATKSTNFVIHASDGSQITGGIAYDGQSKLVTVPAGSTSVTCDNVLGSTLAVVPPNAVNVNVGTNPTDFACNFTAVQAQTGTANVCSNINFANISVACGGQSYSHYMNPVGNKWCFTTTLNAGACSLSNTAQTGYSLSVSSDPASGTLSPGGAITFNLTYAQSGGGSGAICGNGTVEGSEQCDDHNNVSGDGCSATCQEEHTGPSIPTEKRAGK